MRILCVLAVVAVGLVAVQLVSGALGGKQRSTPLDWRAARIGEGAGIAMPYPAGWNATSNDGRDIVVASFPVSKAWIVSERKSLPAKGVYIWAFAYGQLADPRDSRFPPRPARLELERRTFGYYECGFNLAGYNLFFRDHGHLVQVMVALGPQADSRAALAVINRLRVA